MTMTERPPIPAQLMADQPVSEEALDRLDALREAFGAQLPTILALARSGADEEPAEGEDPTMWANARELAATDPEVVRFQVSDDNLAEWAMRKLAALQAERAEQVELASTWKAEIDAWLTSVVRPIDARAGFFEGHLAAYMRARRETTGAKVKSIPLPSGRLESSGSTAPRPAIEDPEALLAWARELPEALQAEEWTPIKTTEVVQVSRLANIVDVHEVRVPVEGMADDEGEQVYEVRRVVTLQRDPETGEAWPEDFDPLKHAIPGARVEVPEVSYRVKPTL